MNAIQARQCGFDKRLTQFPAAVNVDGSTVECVVDKIDSETYRFEWGPFEEFVKIDKIEGFTRPDLFDVHGEVFHMVLILPTGE